MGNIGWSELIVIFLLVLLFFGAKRIPEVARALGKATREFKDAKDGVISEITNSEQDSATKLEKTASSTKDSQSENKDA
jgi:sec-independent protein translocase protein TatA